MGMSADAHIAFGWIMPDEDCAWQPGHEKCTYDAAWDGWDCKVSDDHDFDIEDDLPAGLEYGWAGHIDHHTSPILYLSVTEQSTYWKPTKLRPMGAVPAVVEASVREAAAGSGLRLPDEPPQWILWPSYG